MGIEGNCQVCAIFSGQHHLIIGIKVTITGGINNLGYGKAIRVCKRIIMIFRRALFLCLPCGMWGLLDSTSNGQQCGCVTTTHGNTIGCKRRLQCMIRSFTIATITMNTFNCSMNNINGVLQITCGQLINVTCITKGGCFFNFSILNSICYGTQ